MPLSHAITIAVSVAGSAVALIVGVSYLFTRWYGTPRRMTPGSTPADFGMPFEHVTFLSGGKSLSGWFIPPAQGNNPWPAVILSHGWSYRASFLLSVARELTNAGFAVITYDARGHGDSEGDGFISIVKISEDILSAFSYASGRGDVDDSRIGLVGHSIGGAGAVLAASKDPRIRCLVSVSAFADPLEITGRYLRRYYIPRWPFLWLVRRFIEAEIGTDMTKVSPKNCIGRVTVPALLVHGEADRFIPPSNMEAILAHSRTGNAEGWLVPGRRHADVFLDPAFAPRVSAFLRNTLSRETLD